jgi:hypothetical protein
MKYFLYSKVLNAYITLPSFQTTPDINLAFTFNTLADAAEKLVKAKSLHSYDYEIWDYEALSETLKIS